MRTRNLSQIAFVIARLLRRMHLSLTIMGILLLVISIHTIEAQQSQAARVAFIIDPSEYDTHIGRVIVELQNKLDEYQPTLRFAITFFAYKREDTIASLEPNKPVTIEELTNRNYALQVNQDRRIYNALSLTVSEREWPGSEAATLTFISTSGKSELIIQDLPVQPSKYQIKVLKQKGLEQGKVITDITLDMLAGQKYLVQARSAGFLESLKEKYLSKESLLITIILGLIAILVAVLKDKIKDASNWLLDNLGKYGKGKLAQKRFLRRYLSVITSNHRYLKLIGFNTTGISRPLLEDVFVSLRIAGSSIQSLNTAGSLEGREESQASIPLATALRQYKRLVILGGPGAGKTTALSYTLLAFAQNKGRERFGIQEHYLPVFIHLRRLSDKIRPIVDDILDEETQIISPEVLKEYPNGYFEKMLKAGRCIILFDGLDEVADESTYNKVVNRINEMVAAYPENRYVVTCRIAGWKSLLSGEFTVLQTQDFNRDEIQRFVYSWHRAVITQSEYTRLQIEYPEQQRFEVEWKRHNDEKVKSAIEIQTKNLLLAVDTSKRILAIAVNPMLLSLISLVHFVRHILPRGRTILYSQCLELLIDAWDRSREITWHQPSRINAQQKEAVLREIAFEFQLKGIGEDTRENLVNLIGRITRRLRINMSANELLEEIEQRSGLLVERSIGVFGFSHLTLQEYLVAKHLQLNSRNRKLISENLDKQEWREVTLLYAGLLDDATELVREIGASPVSKRLILAGHCIGDAQRCDTDVSERIILQLLDRLKEDSSNEIIEALSAIAADIHEKPVTAEEKLSNELIRLATDDNTNPALKLDCISILARAKVTRALPALTELLTHPDKNIKDSARSALISFGNLAIPELVAFIDANHCNSMSNTSFTHIFDTILLGKYMEPFKTETEVRSFAIALLACIRVLRDINTGASAKTLMSFYKYPSRVLHMHVSLALSQMLNNYFTESDLKQIEVNLLPASVRAVSPNEGGWAYKDLPQNSGFLHLDALLRKHLLELSMAPARSVGVNFTKASDMLKLSSFKIRYPVLVEHIRRGWAYFSTEELDKPRTTMESFKLYGFKENESDNLAALSEQIRTNPSMTLEYTLNNSHNQSTSENITSSWIWGVAYTSILLMTVGSITQLYLLWLISENLNSYHELFQSPTVFGVLRLLLFILPALLHLSVFALVLSKLWRKLRWFQYIFAAFVPYIFFLRVLPYFTRINLRLKSLLYHLAIFLFSVSGIIVLGGSFLHWSASNSILMLNLLIISIYIGASLFYLNYRVLPLNPIYQLLLLHPDGRKLIEADKHV